MRDDMTSNLQTMDKESDAAEPSSPAQPSLDLDASEYLPDLDGIDITEAQKVELLGILWSIMRSFVDLGFDVGLADPCGRILGGFNAAADQGADGVDSIPSPHTEMPSHGTDKDRE